MFAQVCVGAQQQPDFRTWDQITTELGHQQRALDVLIVDIEGHEPVVLAELRHDTPSLAKLSLKFIFVRAWTR
jgi:hypothetical protein